MKNKAEINFEKGMELVSKAFKHSGHLFKKYNKMAVKYFRLAAYDGHADAQWELGLCYEKHGVLKTNLKREFYWLLKAAKQGHPEACNSVGICYDNAEGVKKNPKEAIKWYKKAVALGDSLAKGNLAISLKQLNSKNKKK
jgi:TPR repeat protein